MSIDPTRVGASVGPVVSSWDARDCMLYALSVGACMDNATGPELRFVTENTRGVELVALPTMATVLGGVLTAPSPLAQIGDYDRRKSVHGSVELELHRPLPTAATIESTITVDGIFDKRSGALVVLRVDASDASGPVFTIRNGIFVRDEGGFGGEPGPAWRGGATPEETPTAVTSMVTRVEQPLLYRLNGDRNPLHSDPAVAAAAGFEQPIMHGLCTLGFVGRALIAYACEGDPSRVARIGARFSTPVVPGDTIVIRIWPRADDVFFAASVGDRPVLSAGYLTIR